MLCCAGLAVGRCSSLAAKSQLVFASLRSPSLQPDAETNLQCPAGKHSPTPLQGDAYILTCGFALPPTSCVTCPGLPSLGAACDATESCPLHRVGASPSPAAPQLYAWWSQCGPGPAVRVPGATPLLLPHPAPPPPPSRRPHPSSSSSSSSSRGRAKRRERGPAEEGSHT